jgi:hypothetical protein
VFDGRLLALEGRVSGSEAPSVVLRIRGQRAPDASPADGAPSAFRVGVEVLQAQVQQEHSPVVFRLSAEATGDLATGPGAVRVGTVVALVGLGSLFDGSFRLQQVALRYDQIRGLHMAVTGQR